MSRPKFSPGRKITSVETLYKIVFTQGDYVYLNHKPMHPGWVMSMQFRSIATMVKRGFVRRAVPQ